METLEVVERDGALYLLTPWEQSWNEPVFYRLFYPTGVKAEAYGNLVGCGALPALCEPGLYRVLTHGHTYIRMENGGETRPAHKETKKIRKPRGAKEYRNGQWFRW